MLECIVVGLYRGIIRSNYTKRNCTDWPEHRRTAEPEIQAAWLLDLAAAYRPKRYTGVTWGGW